MFTESFLDKGSFTAGLMIGIYVFLSWAQSTTKASCFNSPWIKPQPALVPWSPAPPHSLIVIGTLEVPTSIKLPQRTPDMEPAYKKYGTRPKIGQIQ